MSYRSTGGARLAREIHAGETSDTVGGRSALAVE